ncbi:MAG TPA: hypothetical protein VH308_02385 [Terracidiphilus sp.]|nr:hypothetical protein [Terracidiphilus sp.]
MLHPNDEDLSMGTPVLHPNDEDLSMGTPDADGRVDLSVVAREYRYSGIAIATCF